MSELYVETHKLSNGKTLTACIGYDEYAENPREWDCLGTILITPDKKHWINLDHDDIVDTDIEMGKNPYQHWENLRREQLNRKKSEIALAFPITKHEHGTVHLSLGYSQGWDKSVVGFIYITKEKVKQVYDVNRVTKSILERVENSLRVELDILSDWLNGHCYEWQFYIDDELDEYAGGYIGDYDLCLEHLKDGVKIYTAK